MKFFFAKMEEAFNAGVNWKEKYSKDVIMPGLLKSDGTNGGTMAFPDFDKFMNEYFKKNGK